MALLYTTQQIEKKKEKRGKRKFLWHFANSNTFLQAKCLFLYLSSKLLCKKTLQFLLKENLYCLFFCVWERLKNMQVLWMMYCKKTGKLNFSIESSIPCAYSIKVNYFQDIFFHLLYSFDFRGHCVLINGISNSLERNQFW